MITDTPRLLLLLVDIVGYSKMPSVKQRAAVEHLRSIWESLNPGKVLALLKPPTSPISIGDGFIFCGQDTPEVVDFFLRFIVAEVEKQRKLPPVDQYSTRFALHAGECFVLKDNVLGHPMNELARVASCALEGQVLASKAFWKRLRHYHDANPDSLQFSLDDICYDAYLVKFKHDTWIVRGLELELEGGSKEDRTVLNLLFPPNTSLTTFELGNPWPPDNSISYTGENNYHARFQFSRSNFIFRSEEELFLYHCTKNNEKLMCLAFGSHYVRLPFAIEYAATPEVPLLLTDTIATNFEPKEEKLLEQLTVQGRIHRRESAYEDNELLCLRYLDLKEDVNCHGINLHITKCNYRHYLATNLAVDWFPRDGTHKIRKCLRDELTHVPGLPNLNNPELTNPIGVSAWIVSKDRKVLVQSRAAAGLHSNVSTPSISVSAVADWADRLQLPSVGPHGPLPSDERLQQLLSRLPVSTDRAIVRETVEELKIFPQKLSSIEFLGIAREFWRLGKPEFFYLIRVNENYPELRRLANEAGCSWEHLGLNVESFQLVGDKPSDWVDQLLERLVTISYNPISKAGLFFLICYGLGANRPGPLGTGGQTWTLRHSV